jgi:hypothetical protein
VRPGEGRRTLRMKARRIETSLVLQSEISTMSRGNEEGTDETEVPILKSSSESASLPGPPAVLSAACWASRGAVTSFEGPAW